MTIHNHFWKDNSWYSATRQTNGKRLATTAAKRCMINKQRVKLNSIPLRMSTRFYFVSRQRLALLIVVVGFRCEWNKMLPKEQWWMVQFSYQWIGSLALIRALNAMYAWLSREPLSAAFRFQWNFSYQVLVSLYSTSLVLESIDTTPTTFKVEYYQLRLCDASYRRIAKEQRGA